MAASLNEQLQEIYRAYRREKNIAHGDPVELHDVMIWAYQTRQWAQTFNDMISHGVRQMSKALRQEYRTDASGRRVRVHHSVMEKGENKQMHLWGDGEHMSREFMQRSFQQRRIGGVSVFRQLKNDVDSWNDCHPGEQIEIVWDIRDDLAEMEIAQPMAASA